MNEADNGVLIGNGRNSIRLTRAGHPNELGYPTLIEVQAGPFRGSVLDETVGFANFRSQLTTLYESLHGNAKLDSYEGFELNLSGNGSGGIKVSVKVIGEHVPLIQLAFDFYID